jgi:intracellular sulfur oxidation DsrE/DsrF family protein
MRFARVLCAFLVIPAALAAQGPVIQATGVMRDVPNVTYKPDPKLTYKYRWDVTDSAATGEVNPGFLGVARVYNQFVADGVPRKNVQLAIVVHGRATLDLMANEPYKARLGRDNPNLVILDQLSKAGVQVIVCGQALLNRNVARDAILPLVQVASSATTAHVILAAKGYGTAP